MASSVVIELQSSYLQSQQISVRSPEGNGKTVSLTLQPLTLDDLDEFHSLHADPRVWEHLPSGRHTTLERSQKDLIARVSDWKLGWSYWSIKDSNGHFAGVGGVRLIGNGLVWNLYYRVAHAWWGCGIAAKVAIKGVEAAHSMQPNIPVVAYLLEHNEASRHIAEKVLKLHLRWRGPDAGNPDSKAIRLVFSDRPLDDAALRIVLS